MRNISFLRVFVMTLVVLVNFTLQTTFFRYIEILGVQPDTALIIVCGYAVLRGDVEGAILGFFTGLLHDVYFNPVVGTHALLGLLIGYFCGKPLKDFYRENYFLPVLLVGFSSLLSQFAYYIFYFLLRGKTDLLYYSRAVMAPAVVYTLVLAMPVYVIVYSINKRVEDAESGVSRRFRMRKRKF